MSELPNSSREEGDAIPTEAEVEACFSVLLEGREHMDRRKLRDEKGLYLWEIIIPTVDGSMEYAYMRKGRYVGMSAAETAIQIYYFDADGMPTGGDTAAKFIDSQWRYL